MKDITPSYLTKDFLKRTIENGLKIPDINIDDFVVSPGSGIGENYCSEILRVCVKYKTPQKGNQDITLILKNILTNVNADVKEAFEMMDIVNIEITMYTKVVPEIEYLFGNTTMLAPKCFAADKEAKLLVLADLKALGYELQDRITGLDESQCILVMRKIAQFHAGTMSIVKSDSNYAETFDYSLFNEYNLKSEHFCKVFNNNFEQMIRVVKAWPGYEAIVGKLEKISSNLMERGAEHCKRKEGELQVINHGDLWVNNMMFKKNTDRKTPVDVAFVDLQMSYYGSLGIDINYFLNTSPQLEVLKSKRADLLKVYYETLKLSLEQLKYSPIPSWEEVSQEVRAKEFYGLVALACVFPIICMDRSASQNNTIDTMLEVSEEKTNAMFGSKRMTETLKYSLERFDVLGVLDEK